MRMMSNVWASALSWCNIQVWYSYNSGLFLHTASLKHTKTSWYNCLFTIWPHGTNSWWTMPFQSNITNITLISDLLIHAFFGRGDPFPIHCDDCILPSTSYPHLISCYDVLKEVFITICIGKKFLTDFNTVLFLIISQQTQHKFCTDAMHLKFLSKNLMTRSYADAHFVSNVLDS